MATRMWILEIPVWQVSKSQLLYLHDSSLAKFGIRAFGELGEFGAILASFANVTNRVSLARVGKIAIYV